MVAKIFSDLGFFPVAVFFFISAFGLTTSYIKKGDKYLNSFIRNRIIPFYIIIVVLLVVYFAEQILIGKEVSMNVTAIVRYFTFGRTIIGSGWYLQVQLLMYILFYLSFRFIRTPALKIISVFSGTAIYYLVTCLRGYAGFWYVGVLAFPIGILFAFFKDGYDDFFDTNIKRLIFMVMESLLIVVLFLCKHYIIEDALIQALLQTVLNLLSVSAVLLLMRSINIKNPITVFLGKISLGIYLLQGIFFDLYSNKYIKIENQWLYFLLVVISTVLFAMLFERFTALVYRIFRREKRKI